MPLNVVMGRHSYECHPNYWLRTQIKKEGNPSVDYTSNIVNFYLLEQKHDDSIIQKETFPLIFVIAFGQSPFVSLHSIILN